MWHMRIPKQTGINPRTTESMNIANAKFPTSVPICIRLLRSTLWSSGHWSSSRMASLRSFLGSVDDFVPSIRGRCHWTSSCTVGTFVPLPAAGTSGVSRLGGSKGREAKLQNQPISLRLQCKNWVLYRSLEGDPQNDRKNTDSKWCVI